MDTATPKHSYESFDTFGPHAYLMEYYSDVDYENNELLKFYVDAFNQIPNVGTMLEFSGGPTIYSLITAASKADEIHFSDYLTANRIELKRWLKNHSKAFNWDHFIRTALLHEGLIDITPQHIEDRKNLLRSKIKKVVKSNAFRSFSLKHNNQQLYDTVNVGFVAESITSEYQTWTKAVGNICSLVKPSGHLIITSLKKSEFYEFDDKKYPAVQLVESDITYLLNKNGFNTSTMLMRSINAFPYRGYQGMIFVKIQKKP